MADFIKNLSDNHPIVSIVLVGVADSITELVGDHPSVQRNLVQIELPPMPGGEIQDIIKKGCKKLKIGVAQRVLDDVALLANGFPHYAHLLGLSMAKTCANRKNAQIDRGTFHSQVCDLAIEDAIEIYREAFAKATRTSKQSRYPSVLCACAFAEHDEMGVFRAADVVDSMMKIFKEAVTVPAVVPALGEFCKVERGAVLTKVPHGGRSHYKFGDPMMRSFLRIKARAMRPDNGE